MNILKKLNTMNLKKLYPILFLFLSFNFYAQNDKEKDKFKEKREQIKTMKVAFLTTELDLTPSEAEKFWPLYNTYDDKQFELRHQKMKDYYKRIKDDELNNLSEKEAASLLNQIEDNEEDLFNLKMKFVKSLKGILPSVKIIKLAEKRQKEKERGKIGRKRREKVKLKL